MSPELTVLALAGLWQGVQIALMSVPANRELGTSVTLSPRDGPGLQERLSPRTARLWRAMNNHFEALILFIAAVVVVELSGSGSALTAGCAWTYLAARIAYVPAYAAGLSPWRSLIWSVGFGATMLMILAALLAAGTAAQPA